jgi:organic hydroperoxide reductase OsmC/OhrA
MTAKPQPKARTHRYVSATVWTGNRGTGTSGYKEYGREHDLVVPGKPVIAGSSDPAFRGDAARHNPEDLVVASLSACHMLWYLHLCAAEGIVVVDYRDAAEATMEEGGGRPGRFIDAVLRPEVAIAKGDRARALALHERAHAECFVANSVNFPVRCEPTVTFSPAP